MSRGKSHIGRITGHRAAEGAKHLKATAQMKASHRRRQSSEVRGANVNLYQPTPCQKLKTPRIWSTIFGKGPKFTFNKKIKLKIQ